MKKPSLFAVIGSGMLIVCFLLSKLEVYMLDSGRWELNTFLFVDNYITGPCAVIGYGFLFYFFISLYKKQ